MSSEVEFSMIGMSEAIHEALSTKDIEHVDRVDKMFRDLVKRTFQFTTKLNEEMSARSSQ